MISISITINIPVLSSPAGYSDRETKNAVSISQNIIHTVAQLLLCAKNIKQWFAHQHLETSVIMTSKKRNP
jgi:hypothetical protein